MISPVARIYKANLKKQSNQNGYSQNKKLKKLFQDVLDKEMSMGSGSKITVRV